MTALLIVALSARALAQSARRGGFLPRVLDGFADLDTRAAAATWRQVPLRAGDLDDTALLVAADVLDPGQRLPVLCGSGFENRTRLLARLCRQRPLLGNSPETIRAVKQPRRLAALLAHLDIPHPEIGDRTGESTQIEDRIQSDWLVKRAGASGGDHVRPNVVRLGRGDYRQRRVPGRSLSALFLANGRRARLLGWNETWSDAGDPDRPYTYGGALTLSAEQIPEAIRTALPESLDRLVDATGLVGLCGVDLIATASRWWLIEINPRPPATCELHERDRSLLVLHRDAVHGRLPKALPPMTDCRGHAVVYATRRLGIPECDWPDWVNDRPAPGTTIDAGQPICTLRATGNTATEVRTRLARQRHQLLAFLFDGTPS